MPTNDCVEDKMFSCMDQTVFDDMKHSYVEHAIGMPWWAMTSILYMLYAFYIQWHFRFDLMIIVWSWNSWIQDACPSEHCQRNSMAMLNLLKFPPLPLQRLPNYHPFPDDRVTLMELLSTTVTIWFLCYIQNGIKTFKSHPQEWCVKYWPTHWSHQQSYNTRLGETCLLAADPGQLCQLLLARSLRVK